MLIDTHTHLFSEAFNEDRTEIVNKAINAGVEKMLLPNIDVASINGLFNLVEQFPSHCFPMMGLHPGSVGENFRNDLEEIYTALVGNHCVAVGEIGMDLYWDKTFIEEQKEAFRIQVEWAKEHQLPIVIHAREAFQEIFAILDELNDERLTGVFHCFTGTLEDAQKIESYGGFYLGIGGVVTYKKSELPEVLKHVNLDRIVVETDSPYLPPVPFRGKRNESSYVVHVAEKLSEIYGVPLSEIERITTNNAHNLFKLI